MERFVTVRDRPEFTATGAVKAIRDALNARSDRRWSVRHGRGTGYGWLTITAPPARLDEFGGMSGEDRAELGRLLAVAVHHQGVAVEPSEASYREFLARAAGAL